MADIQLGDITYTKAEIDSKDGVNATAISDNTTDITAIEAKTDYITVTGAVDLDALKAPISTKYVPQSTPPAYTEGQVYYSSVSKTFVMQGPFVGITVAAGHGEHIHVVNNSGVTIEAGMAVRPNGIVDGEVQVVKALADTFAHARILGVAIVDIPNGTESAVATSGFIENIDTAGLDLGTPMYLSATTAGTYTSTAPDIRTQIGGVFVAHATTGKLFVSIVNNKSIPTVYGGLTGQAGTGVYSLTTTAQDVDDYDVEDTIVTSVNKALGKITLPNTGKYKVNFTGNISFTDTTTTRTVYAEIYDETGSVVHYTYVKNIPRNATVDSLVFHHTINETAGNIHKIRIKSNVAMDVTFDSIEFDIISVSIEE